MAIGSIIQIKGPFALNSTFSSSNSNFNTGTYIVGVSLGEKDLMSWHNSNPSYQKYEHYPRGQNQTFHEFGDLYFQLNGNEIHLGKNGIYETQQPINNPQIIFPQGAPASLIIDLVQII